MKMANTERKTVRNWASIVSSLLCAVLFVCANTTSSTMIHEPQAPADLARFSKIK